MEIRGEFRKRFGTPAPRKEYFNTIHAYNIRRWRRSVHRRLTSFRIAFGRCTCNSRFDDLSISRRCSYRLFFNIYILARTAQNSITRHKHTLQIVFCGNVIKNERQSFRTYSNTNNIVNSGCVWTTIWLNRFNITLKIITKYQSFRFWFQYWFIMNVNFVKFTILTSRWNHFKLKRYRSGTFSSRVSKVFEFQMQTTPTKHCYYHFKYSI